MNVNRLRRRVAAAVHPGRNDKSLVLTPLGPNSSFQGTIGPDGRIYMKNPNDHINGFWIETVGRQEGMAAISVLSSAIADGHPAESRLAPGTLHAVSDRLSSLVKDVKE